MKVFLAILLAIAAVVNSQIIINDGEGNTYKALATTDYFVIATNETNSVTILGCYDSLSPPYTCNYVQTIKNTTFGFGTRVAYNSYHLLIADRVGYLYAYDCEFACSPTPSTVIYTGASDAPDKMMFDTYAFDWAFVGYSNLEYKGPGIVVISYDNGSFNKSQTITNFKQDCIDIGSDNCFSYGYGNGIQLTATYGMLAVVLPYANDGNGNVLLIYDCYRGNSYTQLSECVISGYVSYSSNYASEYQTGEYFGSSIASSGYSYKIDMIIGVSGAYADYNYNADINLTDFKAGGGYMYTCQWDGGYYCYVYYTYYFGETFGQPCQYSHLNFGASAATSNDGSYSYPIVGAPSACRGSGITYSNYCYLDDYCPSYEYQSFIPFFAPPLFTEINDYITDSNFGYEVFTDPSMPSYFLANSDNYGYIQYNTVYLAKVAGKPVFTFENTTREASRKRALLKLIPNADMLVYPENASQQTIERRSKKHKKN